MLLSGVSAPPPRSCSISGVPFREQPFGLCPARAHTRRAPSAGLRHEQPRHGRATARTRMRSMRSSQRRQQRHRAATGTPLCQQRQQQPDEAERPEAVTAGIPLSCETFTAAGQRLMDVLIDGSMSRFVSCVKSELEELAQPRQASIEDSAHRVAFARIRAVCEDVMYAWALAETYSRDAEMRQEMRAMLGREPGRGMLSEGTDGKLLQTRVQFLVGHEGQYRLGSVAFRAESAGTAAIPSPTAMDWHPELDLPPDTDVRPALDPVMASARGQYLLATEGDTPTRMDRDGAAKTYATFSSWGYFNRRMWLRRQLKLEEQFDAADIMPDPTTASRAETSYGTTSAAWRFFEAVPAELSEFRTPEASSVADRHLRALFGSLGGECITTLAAWTVMCEEARSFGRALYDAEQIILNTIVANAPGG